MNTQALRPWCYDSITPKITLVGPLDPNENRHRGGNRFGSRAASRDRGGNSLKTATSVRPYLQGFMPPGSVRPLRDKTSRTDPDFYRLFDNQSPNTFQANALLISCELRNLSASSMTIALLNRQGGVISGSRTTVAPGQDFIYGQSLSRSTFYIRVTTAAAQPSRYQLNLSIINS